MKLMLGDCLEQLKLLPDNSVDALVTDPPAGIAFMGKDWDKDKGGRSEWVAWMTEVMRECLRVMKPGAHGLVWAIPRTSHWMAWALEDAGFEVRDVVTHLFGSGFPKSLDVSKAIDKAAGATREVVGENPNKRDAHVKGGRGFDKDLGGEKLQSMGITAPATDDAKQWAGWGTALKPASEHWILVRKPCSEKTVAANVLKWGTGALNVDASRVSTDGEVVWKTPEQDARKASVMIYDKPGAGSDSMFKNKGGQEGTPLGRFPANLILSHSDHCIESQCDIECAVRALDEQSLAGGMHSAGKARTKVVESNYKASSYDMSSARQMNRVGDSGGASRFFYCAKAAKSEKNAGLDGMPKKNSAVGNASGRGFSETNPYAERLKENNHPTVKAQKLMTYLCRMVTPPGGTVLDPFAGSGSTGAAALSEGWDFIGIEKDPDYFKILERRVFHAFPKVEKEYQPDNEWQRSR